MAKLEKPASPSTPTDSPGKPVQTPDSPVQTTAPDSPKDEPVQTTAPDSPADPLKEPEEWIGLLGLIRTYIFQGVSLANADQQRVALLHLDELLLKARSKVSQELGRINAELAKTSPVILMKRSVAINVSGGMTTAAAGTRYSPRSHGAHTYNVIKSQLDQRYPDSYDIVYGE